jgi:hypothetical protein
MEWTASINIPIKIIKNLWQSKQLHKLRMDSLEKELCRIQKEKADIVALEVEIEGVLIDAIKKCCATRGSIYLKNNEPHVQFSYPRMYMLEFLKIPKTKSLAGRCFNDGQILVLNDPLDHRRYKGADGVFGVPQNIITCPIWSNKSQASVIAVIQLLNKKGGFDESDEDYILKVGKGLSGKMQMLIDKQKNEASAGGDKFYQISEEVILCCDLTNSYKFFKTLSLPGAAAYINVFLKMASDIILRNGGILEKFVGDGFIARFDRSIN